MTFKLLVSFIQKVALILKLVADEQLSENVNICIEAYLIADRHHQFLGMNCLN